MSLGMKPDLRITNPVITNHLGEVKNSFKRDSFYPGRICNEMELFPGLKIRYKRKFGLSGVLITGLLCNKRNKIRVRNNVVASSL